MKLSEINRKKYALKMLVYVLVGMLAMPVGGLPVAEAASCMDLADIPLESMEEEGPGLIMFVVDDSGSMDWSTMVQPSQESNGIFDNSYEYVFSNPGDDIYSTWNSVEDAGTDVKMKWMSQWSGYNGMYYDPTVEYTPWPWPDNAPPFESPANVDSPRSNPMVDANRFDLSTNGTAWHEWGNDIGVIVDNSDAGGFMASAGWVYRTSGGQDDNYIRSDGTQATVTATWTATGLDPTIPYNVEARWVAYSSRSTAVTYRTYDSSAPSSPLESTTVNQQQNSNTWTTIATDVTFSSGAGAVAILEHDETTGTACADAVRFVPQESSISDIARRHYYVQSEEDNQTYLVNITDEIEYYRVDLDDPDDNDEVVTAGMLTRVTSPPADISTDWNGDALDYTKLCQNFANWYSFYRRRELTAKNAIGNVINTIEGVFVGIISINYNIDEQILKPVRVNLDGTTEDKSEELLTALYNLNSYGSTPLRNGLKAAGEYFKGNYLKPASSEYIKQDDHSYPYFTEDEGGSCQQAFTVLFTDGYYNGSGPGVGNEDGNNDTDYDGGDLGDDYSDTLADVAMRYYEDDLKDDAYLEDNLSVSLEDPATHQHMVTYTVAFGVTGELDADLYADCPLGACPDSWPSNGSDAGKIDDMFHAAVNGRGAFIAASNSEELNEALEALQSNIENRLGASAALATNSIQLSVGSVIYQGTYNTSSWFGEVSALSLDVISGVVSETPIWQASDGLPDWGDRTILSYANGAGVVFEAGNLTTAQKDLLVADAPTGVTAAADVVNYIRGDTSKSVESGGLLRNRTHPLGDIVHSAPTYYKGMVYIGANDGMLHGFDSSTGVEKFAYVPSMVYDHLGELSNPNYNHKYYVDNTAAVAKVGSQNVLVCGLGKGGKGYFGLDVTEPDDMTPADVLWEFTDSDLGYSFSKAFIVNTKAAGDVVVFGNGYDTADGNGHAILYVLDALTGTEIKRFDTGVGSVTDCNGMSTPAPVDVELDGYVDYVFAGDLKGNMWKFDLRGAEISEWTSAYTSDGLTPMPLITVRNADGDVQPITSPPEVMLDCSQVEESAARGLMVIFGTGKYLHYTDFNDYTVQSFYGIWDWGPIWEAEESPSVAQRQYLGTFEANRNLSNLEGTIGLLKQEFIWQDSAWGVLTDNLVDWYNPFATGDSGYNLGWYIDLIGLDGLKDGERSLLQPTLTAGAAILISTIPSGSPCEAGGSSGTYIINACTGGRYPYPAYDVNDDDTIDKNDTVQVDGVPIFPQWHPDPKIIYDLLIISGEAYRQDAQGNIEQFDTVENLPGMFFWRVIGQ